MSNLEHLIENTLCVMANNELSGEEIRERILNDSNFEYVNMSVDEIYEICQYMIYTYCWSCKYNPSAIVHCKDCKHREEHHYEENGEPPYIKYSCKFSNYSMSDDGFCSFGEVGPYA